MNRRDDELQELQKQNAFLKRENNMLKQLIQRNNIPIPNTHQPIMNISTNTTKQEILNNRINIFKNLFKGREDVYAVRWEYKGGKSGYSPVRKRDGENKQYIPLTNRDIFNHLSGKKIIGIYPMLKNETCWF